VHLLRRLSAAAILARATTSVAERPDRLARAIVAMAPWGTTLGGLVAASAARYPERVAVHDERGDTTYRELWRASRAVARGLLDNGVRPGMTVGILCRNHGGFVESLVGAAVTGADVVLLNTGFAGPQLADVVAQEQIGVVLHDDDFAEVVSACGATTHGEEALSRFRNGSHEVPPRREHGRLVILTSGTTGRPKGAARGAGSTSPDGAAAVLDRIPLRLGDVQVVAAPLFHGWGLTNLVLGLSRSATTVLARRFDAATTLRATSEHGAQVLVVVPVMLARLLALEPAVLVESPTPNLRVIASSGSALGGPLATAVLDRFGPVLYNLYGTTEVAVATIAVPEDLRAAPSTAGRVVFGARVAVLDARGSPVPDGTTGRIFVGSASRFDGYTGGGAKEERDGLLSTGDVGYFRRGLLFVEGREDDMIVSGGENVYPSEVEELLARHPQVAEAAVVGVPDDEYGQALAAFVVPRPGASLTAEDVRAHVRDRLARHKVPRRVQFVDELPRNTTGKILRRVLAERGAQ
jgi:fatty-acyl-CoA synthase